MKLKNLYIIAGLLTFSLALSMVSVMAATLPMVDDFEQATLPTGVDSAGGAAVGWAPFSDAPLPTLTLQTVLTSTALARPGQGASNSILKVEFTSAGGYRGFTHAFENAAATLWVSQDWSSSSYTGISLWLYGANTGGNIQVEVFDTRANLAGDTAERWKNVVLDNFTGWKKIEIPFTSFNDGGYHPAGSDGIFQRTAVWGWALNLPASNATIYVDDVMLYGSSATATPTATAAATATSVVTATATSVVTPTATSVVPPTATSVVTPTATSVVPPTATSVVTPTATAVVPPTATAVVTPTATATPNVTMLDDFEANMRLGEDSFGNGVGLVPWGSIGGNVVLTQTIVSSTDPLARPNQTGPNRILKVDYNIENGGWGGFTHAFENAAANQWVSQNWKGYTGFSFWIYGSNTGAQIQIEILDNRTTDGDSAERFIYTIDDNFNTWKKFEIPFTSFVHRTGWQPSGAPDDGFTLTEVWGYAFTAPPNKGAHTLYVDDVALYGGSSTTPTPTPGTPTATPVSGIMLDDFEANMRLGEDSFGNGVGLVPWGSIGGNVVLTQTIVSSTDPLARPNQTGPNRILKVDYNIENGGWGGFTHAFENAAANQWVSQNWKGYTGFSFWIYGSNTGAQIQIEILDNRTTDGDSAERFIYTIDDNFNTWKKFEIPFTSFVHRTGWQPSGAPDDGFTLTEVWGYAFTAPPNKGAHTLYVDDVALYGGSNTTPTPTPTSTPVPQISVSLGKTNYQVSEGKNVTISVTIDTTATESIMVDYMTANDVAKAGEDYTAASGTITFSAGDPKGTVKTFLVAALTDTTAEVAESFNVMLANPMKTKIGVITMTKVVINANGFPYLNPNLSTAERVQDLLGRMTTKEKVGQMTQIQHQALESKPSVISDFYLGSLLAGGGGAPKAGNKPVDWANMYDTYQGYAMSTRLQIPLIYGIDAVHGNSNLDTTTIFPHNIGLGATRNPALAERIARVTALEIVPTGIDWTFAPCVCVSRDERWGRTYESFGEHPEIATMMATMIDGYQGTDLSHPDSVLATAKHFIGDGGTTNGVDQGNTEIDEATLRAIHLPPFTESIRRNVGSIMPSYNSWNGVKLHGHDFLLRQLLLGEMGFKGFLISDWAAIDQIPGDYNSDTRISINAGLDMIMVPGDYKKFTDALSKEIADGTIPMSRIDDAISRILTAKFEMGLFERPFSDRTHMDKIGSEEHREVARQSVRESLVLLKNDGKILPLSKTSKILVAGKNADNLGYQMGGWSLTWQGMSGTTYVDPANPNIVKYAIGTDILQGIKKVAPGATVTFNKDAAGTLTGDVGIVVVGEKPYAESAGDARSADKLSLTAEDKAVVTKVCSAMPCVIVLISGRPMLVNDELALSKAFVAAWLPGTEGAGVADVLFGDAPFTGKLPMTWPKSFEQIPINVGDATYDPMFAYGYGLTYLNETAVPTTGVSNVELGPGGAMFTAPANTFNGAVTLRYTARGPEIITGTRRHIGVFYSIEAVDGTGKVVTPTGKYTIKVPYSAAGLPSSIDESTLALYYKDASGNWMKEASSTVDEANDMVMATTNHFSDWAILADATSTPVRKIHLPIIMKK